jgi:GNAT superfamily N-acetyltransferase
MPEDILIRQATLADVGIIAHHRAAMFLDMGSATQDVVAQLRSDTEAYLRQAMPNGEYIGWLASLASRPKSVCEKGVVGLSQSERHQGKEDEAGDASERIVDGGRQSHGALQPGGSRATSHTCSNNPVAGAGVQVRRVLPFPRRWPDGRADVAHGLQAIVLNVYTEPAFRRRGLARRLMHEVLAWARQAQIESLVLHAAPDGRHLYEQLGFAATNEMRFMGDLA